MLLKIEYLLLVCVCLCYLSNAKQIKRTKKKLKSAKPVKRIGGDIAKKYAESEPGFDLTDQEKQKFKLWEDGVVPYYIDQVSYDKVNRDKIRNYLDYAGGVMGLAFTEMITPPTNDTSSRWAFFINRKSAMDCVDHSPLSFTNSGVQKVVLGYDCKNLAQLILALVGVPPQHNAPNRDQYVKVQESNIVPEKLGLFKKLSDQDWLFHDVAYDFNSASHYDFHRHTANGQATLRPIGNYPDNAGEAEDFSEADVWKVHMLYNYITAKKKDSNNECDTLFAPGDNLGRFELSSSEETLKPRRKPNKYLGLDENATQEGSSGLELSSEKEGADDDVVDDKQAADDDDDEQADDDDDDDKQGAEDDVDDKQGADDDIKDKEGAKDDVRDKQATDDQVTENDIK